MTMIVVMMILIIVKRQIKLSALRCVVVAAFSSYNALVPPNLYENVKILDRLHSHCKP